MRIATLMVVAICLGGCSDLYERFFGSSDKKIAQQCGVSEAQVKQMKSSVGKLEPYDGRKLGTCTLIKDDSGTVMVGSIQKPPEADK